MKRYWILYLSVAIIFGSCGGGENRGTAQASADLPKFKYPQVPALMTDQSEIGRYVVAHFWDGYNFDDTLMICQVDMTEQVVADYLNIIRQAPGDQVKASIDAMLERAVGDSVVFNKFTELYEKYLFDPNSPMRYEDHYIYVLQFIIDSDKVDELMKVRPRYQLELAMKNRPGERAKDFKIKLVSGKTSTLWTTAGQYTLLMFFNPGCAACGQMKSEILASPMLKAMREGKRGLPHLSILAVYPDQQMEEWSKHINEMPTEWTVGYDISPDELRAKTLYDLRAIPNLYLLDKSKTVILKDVSVPQVEQFFAQLVKPLQK